MRIWSTRLERVIAIALKLSALKLLALKRRRPAWMTWALFGYLGFMTFNATVVYEEGLIRWLGAGMCLLVGTSVAARAPIWQFPDTTIRRLAN